MPISPSNPAESTRQFCNADSFAIAFDDAWRLQAGQGDGQALSRADLLEAILAQLSDHPFAQNDGARAREVGEFRLRLHGV